MSEWYAKKVAAALAAIASGEMTKAAAARDLGVAPRTIGRWIEKRREVKEGAPISANTLPTDAWRPEPPTPDAHAQVRSEIEVLRDRVAQLENLFAALPSMVRNAARDFEGRISALEKGPAVDKRTCVSIFLDRVGIMVYSDSYTQYRDCQLVHDVASAAVSTTEQGYGLFYTNHRAFLGRHSGGLIYDVEDPVGIGDVIYLTLQPNDTGNRVRSGSPTTRKILFGRIVMVTSRRDRAIDSMKQEGQTVLALRVS